LEGSNLVAKTDKDSPIHLRWEINGNLNAVGHYLLLVVRDTDDQEIGEELVRKTVKVGRTRKKSLKLSLKDVELDEGETCAAKILIQVKDTSGVTLASDESESFYIEGGPAVADTGKEGKGKKVRNRAEAYFLD